MLRNRTFALPIWSRCRKGTKTDTSDLIKVSKLQVLKRTSLYQAPDDQLAEGEGRCLQNGANDVDQ